MTDSRRLDISSIKSCASMIIQTLTDLKSSGDSKLQTKLSEILNSLRSTEEKVDNLSISLKEGPQTDLQEISSETTKALLQMKNLQAELSDFTSQFTHHFSSEDENPEICIEVKKLYFDRKKGKWAVKLHNKSDNSIVNLNVILCENNRELVHFRIIGPNHKVKKYFEAEYSDSIFFNHLVVRKNNKAVSNSFMITPIVITEIEETEGEFNCKIKNISNIEFAALELRNSQFPRSIAQITHPPSPFEKKVFPFQFKPDVQGGYFYLTENGHSASNWYKPLK